MLDIHSDILTKGLNSYCWLILNNFYFCCLHSKYVLAYIVTGHCLLFKVSLFVSTYFAFIIKMTVRSGWEIL